MSRVVYRDTSSLFHICKRFELFIGGDPKHPGQMTWSGWLDSNQRLPVSKTGGIPLTYTLIWWAEMESNHPNLSIADLQSAPLPLTVYPPITRALRLAFTNTLLMFLCTISTSKTIVVIITTMYAELNGPDNGVDSKIRTCTTFIVGHLSRVVRYHYSMSTYGAQCRI